MDQELEELKRRYDSDPENLDLLYSYDRACERFRRLYDGHTLHEWCEFVAKEAKLTHRGERVLLENLPYSFPAFLELSLSQEPRKSRETFALMLNHRNRDAVFPLLGAAFSTLPEHLRALCSGWIVIHAREDPNPAFLTLVPTLKELAQSDNLNEASNAILTLSRWGFGEGYRDKILKGATHENRLCANNSLRAMAYIPPDEACLKIFRATFLADFMLAVWVFDKWHSFLPERDWDILRCLFTDPEAPWLPRLVASVRRTLALAPFYQRELTRCLSESFPLVVQRDALIALIRSGVESPGLEDHYARLELSENDEGKLHLERDLSHFKLGPERFRRPFLSALSSSKPEQIALTCYHLINLGEDSERLYQAVELILDTPNYPLRSRVMNSLRGLPAPFFLAREERFFSWIEKEECGPNFFALMKCFQAHAESFESLAWPLARLPMNRRVCASLVPWVYAVSVICADLEPLRHVALHHEGRFAELDRAFEDAFRRVELRLADPSER